MAKQSVVQSINALSVPTTVKRILNDLFTALRESIAPVNTALVGSAVFDTPSVAAAGTTTTTVAVTGAAIGDYVMASMGVSLQGMTLTGYVSAAGTVTVVFTNPTAGAIDLASTTLRVVVIPQAAFAKAINFGA